MASKIVGSTKAIVRGERRASEAVASGRAGCDNRTVIGANKVAVVAEGVAVIAVAAVVLAAIVAAGVAESAHKARPEFVGRSHRPSNAPSGRSFRTRVGIALTALAVLTATALTAIFAMTNRQL